MIKSGIKTDKMDTDYNGKVVKVLKKLLEPDFKIKNDVYLNSLLTHLTTDPETGCDGNWQTVTKQYLPSWIEEAVTQWEKLGTYPSPQVLSFTLTTTSFVCKDEQTFVSLNSRNIYERLITLIKVNRPTTASGVKLGYIKLISSFLQHKSGLQWIISTNYWADILSLTLQNETLYITKEGYHFMKNLLTKSVKINEVFCSNVIQLIMAPLNDNAPCVPRNAITNSMEVRDQAIYQSLCSTLMLLTEILQLLLESIACENSCKVFSMFMRKFKLEERIRGILLVAQNEEFLFDLYRILCVITFFEWYAQLSGVNTIFECDADKIIYDSKFFNIFTDNINKDSVINVLKLSYSGLVCWKRIGNVMPRCVKNATNPMPILFEDQMLMLQLFPIINVSLRIMGEKGAEDKLDEDEVRDYYVDQVLKKSTQPTMRIFYHWRSCLRSNIYIFEHATLALHYLMKSISTITRDIAVTAFQTLIYCLQDILNVLEQRQELMAVLVKEFNYVSLLLDAIAVFIKEFDFTWRDSLESICVMNLAFEMLSVPAWPTKDRVSCVLHTADGFPVRTGQPNLLVKTLVVKGLKLVDISISKYLTPNMALLMDSIQDSTMSAVGPMLYAKLHDGSWEVRDTALEVICTLSHNANTKFPSFRELILGADLPSLILKMASDDGEAFVRATAVKCLQKIVRVQEFWDNLLRSGNIHDKIIQILQMETEGIVRSEAASLVVDIYEHRDVPPEVLTRFYDIMTHAATADLHWEVKVNALKFWEKVINHHLNHQGMIDGTFPKVTFSKENRKIVTLTETEIRKILIKILNQLSETGCLSVLITALQDDCDLEVSKTATKIMQDFVKLLKNYNVQQCDANLSTPPSPLNAFSAVPTPPYSSGIGSSETFCSMSPLSQLSESSQHNGQFDTMSDCILDEIMNAQDLSLLQGVYNANDQAFDNCVQLRFRKVLTVSDFLKFVDTDFESYASNKEKWLRDIDAFGSLLDDILKEYDNNDVNSMDCY